MSELKAMEHPTLKVPYEILNKKFRMAQKTLDRELNQVQNVTADLEKELYKGKVCEINRLIGGVVERLQVLKRKADESITEELAAGFVCKRRLDHLREIVPLPPPSVQNDKIIKLPAKNRVKTEAKENELGKLTANQWKKIRLDRMIVEHFLRLGYYKSAERLAIRSGIRDLTNLDIFHTSREVEEDLNNHRTTKCTVWCMDNKSKLRKINSNIEFQLRVQEFIELVRSDRKLEAVKHAQKYFPTFERDQLKEIRQVMALLAFPSTTSLEPYRSLFNPVRWRDLILNFRLENYRLFQLSTQSILSVTVQAGLSSLKTPHCYSSGAKNLNCPVCQPNFNEIASDLPFSHCAQSRLICRVTGQPLNERNCPMMLPNGQIFGELAIPTICKDGIIVCPQTNQSFPKPKIEKVYVM